MGQSAHCFIKFSSSHSCSVRSLLNRLAICVALCFAHVSVTYAAGTPEYAEHLVHRAQELKLSEDPTWRALLHYAPRRFLPGVKSYGDDPTFFLSPSGKTDPEAELAATLRAFFVDETETDDHQPAQCRFIARYTWLKERLQFDTARLAEQPCRRFKEWYAALDPAGVTLVFPAAYLNNPASMFGHTLLRIDGREQNEDTRLLAYAANYAASTAETSGPIFAVRGIFGLYYGTFSIAPYYKLVKKYSDLENRDIWEYQLKLTEEEREQLVRHLWELGSTYFDYFFFDENCSFHLLSLLQAARPSLRLTEQFLFWAIPSDTVRAVAGAPDLLGETVYRPSQTTILKERLNRLSEVGRVAVDALASGEVAADDVVLPDEERAEVAELAYDYLNYRITTGKEKDPTAKVRAHKLLIARSRLPKGGEPVAPPIPSVRPDQGHRTARAAVGAFYDENHWGYELTARPAFHDLLDPEPGYVRGAEIRFFDFAVHGREGEGLTLERFTPLRIRSLSPRSRFFRSLSWGIDAGMERRTTGDDGAEHMVKEGSLAFGHSYEPFSNTLVYAMPSASWVQSEGYGEDFSLGVGLQTGALVDLNERQRIELKGAAHRYGWGEDFTTYAIGVEQRITITDDVSVRIGIEQRREYGDDRTIAQLALQLFL